MGSTDILKLLQSAVGAPKYVRTEDGGSIVALTLHCLMVEHGFRVHADRRVEGASEAAPAAEWNGKYDNEWVFNFRRRGYASVFTLHCSLQPASNKMFVHAREVDAPSNMKYMGLLVHKYVPDLARCKQSTWAGVLAEQEELRDQFQEYIIEPLLEAALPSPEADEEAVPPGHAAFRSLSAAHLIMGVSALALSVAVVCLLLKKRHTQPAH